MNSRAKPVFVFHHGSVCASARVTVSFESTLCKSGFGEGDKVSKVLKYGVKSTRGPALFSYQVVCNSNWPPLIEADNASFVLATF